jgi:hypothetical protein
MAMATAMEWEAPIQVWIESLSIDMDEEMPVSNLMVSIPAAPVVLDGTCTPVSDRSHSFLSASTSQSPFDKNCLMLDVTAVATASPFKAKRDAAPPTLSPVKTKRATKAERRPRSKALADPSGREQRRRRKDKQRGYEKDYRSRQKSRRSDDEAEWIALETQLRKLLAKRTSVLVMGALDTARPERHAASTVSIRQKYLELLMEERALRESEALDSAVLAEYRSIALWGGATAASREIRAQVNALPSLRSCHTFDFSW